MYFLNNISIFYDSYGNFQWSSLAAGVALLSAVISIYGVWKNNKTQKEIAKQQIDANLKAKARIEWIERVRKCTSDLISTYFQAALPTNSDGFENAEKVAEQTELLKLYFSNIEEVNFETESLELTFSTCIECIQSLTIKNDLKERNKGKGRALEALLNMFQSGNYKTLGELEPFISNLTREISIYLKYEWDRAKVGK